MGTLRPECPTIWAHGALGIAKATRSKKEAGGKEVAAQVGCLGFGALGRLGSLSRAWLNMYWAINAFRWGGGLFRSYLQLQHSVNPEEP